MYPRVHLNSELNYSVTVHYCLGQIDRCPFKGVVLPYCHLAKSPVVPVSVRTPTPRNTQIHIHVFPGDSWTRKISQWPSFFFFFFLVNFTDLT